MPLTEKYRPESFDELAGQEEIIKKIKNLIKRYKTKDELCPPMLFLGPPGVGKTTIAQCFARELFGENWIRHYKEYNASDHRKIEDVRTTYKRLSKVRGRRVIFLDEFDNMGLDAQQAMRRIMETTKSSIFILSGNREHKIISPIKSRCVIFRFKKLGEGAILRRVLEVCKGEGIKISKENREGLMALVKEANGDLRSALNMLEQLINEDKSISTANIVAMKEIHLAQTALNLALSGNFTRARELIEDAFVNSTYNPTKTLEALYFSVGKLEEKYNPISIRLYEKLAEVDYAIKIGGSPIFQIVGFMAFAWVLPNLPNKCSALEMR